MRRLLLATIAMASVASAQEVITAKAGLIHLMEGKVLINGVETEQIGDKFLSLKESEVLSTERGRAEVLTDDIRSLTNIVNRGKAIHRELPP